MRVRSVPGRGGQMRVRSVPGRGEGGGTERDHEQPYDELACALQRWEWLRGEMRVRFVPGGAAMRVRFVRGRGEMRVRFVRGRVCVCVGSACEAEVVGEHEVPPANRKEDLRGKACPISTGRRDAACPISTGRRDAACPVSTGGWGVGRGGGVTRRARARASRTPRRTARSATWRCCAPAAVSAAAQVRLRAQLRGRRGSGAAQRGRGGSVRGATCSSARCCRPARALPAATRPRPAETPPAPRTPRARPRGARGAEAGGAAAVDAGEALCAAPEGGTAIQRRIIAIQRGKWQCRSALPVRGGRLGGCSACTVGTWVGATVGGGGKHLPVRGGRRAVRKEVLVAPARVEPIRRGERRLGREARPPVDADPQPSQVPTAAARDVSS
jgi:hypothetical protein